MNQQEFERVARLEAQQRQAELEAQKGNPHFQYEEEREMGKTYYLESNQADRANFDEMAARAAEAMLQALTDEEALEQDPQQYAEFSWQEWFDVEEYVDDVEEAEARWVPAFAEAVRAWQHQKRLDDLDDELYTQETGHKTALTVFPGGKKDDLDYGPVLVEIVVLDYDGNTIAYRISTDSHDDDWQLGNTEDAVLALEDYQEQARDTAELVLQEGYA